MPVATLRHVLETATPVEAAAWPQRVLGPRELGLVELVLAGSLPPQPLPLGDVEVAATVALADPEGVVVAGLRVESVGDDGASGTWVRVESVGHVDAADLRATPAEIRAWAAGRHVVTAYAGALTERGAGVLRTMAAEGSCVVLLGLLGPHDVTDSSWYARADDLRVSAALLGEQLGAERVRAVAVPDAGTPRLREQVAASYGDRHMDVESAPAARPDSGGLVVLFTGLSGSGKSTIARSVTARLVESGRTVTLLDGDVVRRHLSSELGFSAEHRDINVRRIGWTAVEVARHGGIAVACPIAPYAAARAAVRAMAAEVGARFVLVHVATPIEVCEARDRKGLYAKARAGGLPGFTGVSDPYEAPTDAEVVVDTSTGSVDDAVQIVLAALPDDVIDD